MTFPNLTAFTFSNSLLRRILPLSTLAILSVVAALMIYTYGLRPAEEHVRNAEQVYQQAKQHQAHLQKTKAQQLGAQAAKRQLEIERHALPTQKEFTPLALALSELAKHEQVRIPGMSYDIKAPEGSRPTKATLTFQATGEYAAIYRFLNRLETFDSYLVIERLDVGREQRDDSSATRIVVNVIVATYLRQTESSL